jgi:hypothetical protein
MSIRNYQDLCQRFTPVNWFTDNCRYSINRFNSITFLCLSQTCLYFLFIMVTRVYKICNYNW